MRIFTWILATILAIVVLLLGLIYFLPGYNMYVVRSDSMKPVFSSGDMVITAPPGSFLTGRIRPGSIVTFQAEGNRVTHRVVSVDNERLVTKGDANQDPDSKPVQTSSVEGIYLIKVPYVGYLNAFLRTKLGWFLVIIVPALLLLSLIVREIIKEALNLGKTGKTRSRAAGSINSCKKD